jgi:hypothetical protein
VGTRFLGTGSLHFISFHFISFVKRILMSINEVVREWCLFIFLRHTSSRGGKEMEVSIEDNKQT